MVKTDHDWYSDYKQSRAKHIQSMIDQMLPMFMLVATHVSDYNSVTLIFLYSNFHFAVKFQYLLQYLKYYFFNAS